MRKITRISLALGTSAALLSLSALPASADEGGTVPPINATATIAIPDAGLSISFSDKGVNKELSVQVAADGLGHAATITVPAITVTDLRAGTDAWEVGVTLSDFTHKIMEPSEDEFGPIAAGGATYLRSNTQKFGTVVLSEEVAPVTLTADGLESDARGTVTKPGTVRGNNEVSWDATVAVEVPSTVLMADYTANLTHSVL